MQSFETSTACLQLHVFEKQWRHEHQTSADNFSSGSQLFWRSWLFYIFTTFCTADVNDTTNIWRLMCLKRKKSSLHISVCSVRVLPVSVCVGSLIWSMCPHFDCWYIYGIVLHQLRQKYFYHQSCCCRRCCKTVIQLFVPKISDVSRRFPVNYLCTLFVSTSVTGLLMSQCVVFRPPAGVQSLRSSVVF